MLRTAARAGQGNLLGPLSLGERVGGRGSIKILKALLDPLILAPSAALPVLTSASLSTRSDVEVRTGFSRREKE
jgi:hypothetical protein